VLQRDFKAVIVKGRSNYLCLRRLQRVRRNLTEELFEPERAETVERIYLQAQNHSLKEGSRQEIEPQPDLQLWGTICSEHGNCQGKRCPFHADCYFQQARLKMYNARILITNHAFFFSDLALRADGAGLLPPYRSVVLDEAHQIEQVASSHLGLRLSPYMLEYWLNRIARNDRSGISLLNVYVEFMCYGIFNFNSEAAKSVVLP
jgi:ATP-dependent DNA helicase DinG